MVYSQNKKLSLCFVNKFECEYLHQEQEKHLYDYIMSRQNTQYKITFKQYDDE